MAIDGLKCEDPEKLKEVIGYLKAVEEPPLNYGGLCKWFKEDINDTKGLCKDCVLRIEGIDDYDNPHDGFTCAIHLIRNIAIKKLDILIAKGLVQP